MDDWERQRSSKLLTTLTSLHSTETVMIAARAAAAAVAAVPRPIPPLRMILGNVLGFTVGQIDAIRDKGYTDFEDFMDVSPEHLRNMRMNLSILTNARGGVKLGGKNTKIVPGDFDHNALGRVG